MESNERYYARRAVEELRAAARAVTPEAQARRRALAQAFQLKAQQCRRETSVSPAGLETATY
ncbi:MAG TPA: hypothetical protein VEA61_01045 [Allosphingosinicella sp.]|nr:hypothetical protein [Allosphingosinicella sp.]